MQVIIFYFLDLHNKTFSACVCVHMIGVQYIILMQHLRWLAASGLEVNDRVNCYLVNRLLSLCSCSFGETAGVREKRLANPDWPCGLPRITGSIGRMYYFANFNSLLARHSFSLWQLIQRSWIDLVLKACTRIRSSSFKILRGGK